ncbi:translation elongation factor Ts [Candidatus Wolfebacteria bacterium RIFOXYB2_FULL_49_7]|uniref:Elongation factor Ts n=1 Tax=Candidatus Wolfebacteria bacterium RIFOXYB1_FULL_54_12 TaxID=1802559 RepID=A0A1F8DXK6_9BACT|nr:MAG: translation elongation factor Ts [Candidatus Wolfebacteria bacterium RIFOXYB1_FULL_54_12]OGM96178.1 MAG: translation elongation factor Ts [Candidatus Wolfebacteria bacterium RIFOXYB2_FULL_49_7]
MAMEDVAKLRELTGAGVVECKKALDEAEGDFDRAKDIIFERGIARAEKKSERATGAGLLETYIHNGRVSVMLELRCETDFVARNEKFQVLAHDIAIHIAAMDPATVEELYAQQYVKDPSMTVEELVKNLIGTIGENMKVEKFIRFEL